MHKVQARDEALSYREEMVLFIGTIGALGSLGTKSLSTTGTKGHGHLMHPCIYRILMALRAIHAMYAHALRDFHLTLALQSRRECSASCTL